MTIKKSENFYAAMLQNKLQDVFEEKWLKGMNYAHKLTLSPGKLKQQDVADLQEVHFSDGEILEMNQVISYFNYANRTVLGLGVHTKGDILGLSPNDSKDPENWSHQ